MLMVSLHATKTVTTGEGGVLIGPEDWIRRVRTWSNFGFQGSRIAKSVATNSKLSEYQAAIGLASLDNWVSDRSQWDATSNQILEILKQRDLHAQPALHQNQLSSTCIVKFENASDRNRTEQVLSTHQIETRRWWGDGLHNMPGFSAFSSINPLTITRELSRTTLGIPFFRDLDSIAINTIASLLLV